MWKFLILNFTYRWEGVQTAYDMGYGVVAMNPLGCGYCDECPQDIAIPSFMQAYNEKHVFHKTDEEMKEYMHNSYEWGILSGKKGTAKDCISCGICERECTQHLPIINRLAEFEKWS